MKDIIQQFEANAELVTDLMEFDRVLIDFVLRTVENTHRQLIESNFDGAANRLNNPIKVIKAVRENNSLKPHYDAMTNQCVVLLVSYFSTALEESFKFLLREAIRSDTIDHFSKETVTITLGQLHKTKFNLSEDIAEIVSSKDDVSFQDMKSVNRVFKKYIGYNHERNSYLDNIIYGQAARHIIVHDSGNLSKRFRHQIESCPKRNIHLTLPESGTIQFDEESIQTLIESMRKYLTALEEFSST